MESVQSECQPDARFLFGNRCRRGSCHHGGDGGLCDRGGVESMNRVPMGSDGGSFSDRLLSKYNIIPQGLSAEMIAEKWGISREEMDEFSLHSHEKALVAQQEGRFDNELVPVEIKGDKGEWVKLDKDETPRAIPVWKHWLNCRLPSVPTAM